MPHLYDIDPNDKRLHSRYTELNMCKPHLMQRVLDRRMGVYGELETPAMYFGTVRHEMIAKECEETRSLPAKLVEQYPSFITALGDPYINTIEGEFKAEIFKDIVLHSCIDAYSDQGLLIDYKTGTYVEGKKGYARRYHSTMQLKVYAYMLDLWGKKVTDLMYVVELWDKPREKFYGYDISRIAFNVNENKETKKWLKERCEVLKAGIELLKNDNEN